jgi:valyl-tRNA synthetase
METGSDILFFWVARMAMLCEEVRSSGFDCAGLVALSVLTAVVL